MKIAVALVAAGLSVGGCYEFLTRMHPCRLEPVYDVASANFARPAQWLGAVEDAIVRAGSKRDWYFQSTGPGQMIGSLAVSGKNFVMVDVTFDLRSFSIKQNKTVNLHHDPEANIICGDYNSWIRQLENDIQLEMQ